MATPAAPAPVLKEGEIINRYGEVERKDHLCVADWARRWNKNQTGWHQKTVHKNLVANTPNFAAQPSATRRPTILVPLCGKTVDLQWLIEQGFNVVGIEIVTQGIIDFFYDSSEAFPKFTAEKITGTNIYRYTASHAKISNGTSLTILQADIFSEQLTKSLIFGSDDASTGFDCVWDRGSLIAINPDTRLNYVKQVVSWMKPQADYLLSAFDYDPSLMNGPPFHVPDAVVEELFRPYFKSIEKVSVEKTQEKMNGPDKPTVEITNGIFFMRR